MKMKKQNNEDERIKIEREKICSEAFGFLIFILMISIIVKQFVFKVPFSQYAVETICFFGAGVYIMIRSFFMGHSLSIQKNKKKNIKAYIIIIGIGTSIGIATTAIENPDDFFTGNIWLVVLKLIGRFIFAATISAAALYGMYSIYNKRKKKIEKKLDDDE